MAPVSDFDGEKAGRRAEKATIEDRMAPVSKLDTGNSAERRPVYLRRINHPSAGTSASTRPN